MGGSTRLRRHVALLLATSALIAAAGGRDTAVAGGAGGCGTAASPAAAGGAAAGPPGTAPHHPWEAVIDSLRGERDRFAADLEAAHAALLARARAEDPALAERLSPAPPAPRPHGYGILPEIRPAPEPRDVAPRRTVYALEALRERFAPDLRDAARLRREAAAGSSRALTAMADTYERLRPRLRNLEDHIGYHAMWQQAVIDDAAFFAAQHAILARVEAWNRLRQSGSGDPRRTDSLRAAIVAAVAPFIRTAGLHVERGPGGARVLRLRITTDITGDAFLQQLRHGVEQIYSESAAARARRFRLAVSYQRLAPEALYPEGVPARGTPLDEHDHLARFPAGALVLTTGAARTHARTGRYVQLGPEPRSTRSLAHEVGHLLGFDDAYLRAARDQIDPDAPSGCVLVEWTGLQNDLMGSPDRGRVTAAMIDTLLAAYSGAATPGAE